eukprot:Phypoly_transcript_04556.p1 GENE.Phypoly_transcript_04556~~Phypoly_transcript_04556.p1  ORF type:complete len:601 (+),score=77.60 Phypoly_transcript_04556:292-2094(+)
MNTEDGLEGGTVNVTIDRKSKIHTNITVVENATRFWLSAQVMVACIMLGLLALSVKSSRHTISTFPETFNTTCVSSTYEVRLSIEHALEVMLDEAVNITNTQYQGSVGIARDILSESMNLTVDVFLLLLKQVNPAVYCTIDSGLAIVSNVKNELRNLKVPTVSCNIKTRGISEAYSNVSDVQGEYAQNRPSRDIDICKAATDALNDVASDISGVVNSWPSIPPSLTSVLDDILQTTGIASDINNLAAFPAPEKILEVNSTQMIQNAMAKAKAFDEIAQTCVGVSVKFVHATHEASKVMYYIEIAIWLAIGVLLLGIFIVGIIRQFPTVVVIWMTEKIDSWTKKWTEEVDELEKTSVRTWKLYLRWTLKYINFKQAILTTAYGLLGIILIVNLTNITRAVQAPVQVWVSGSLGPGIQAIEAKLQEGIDQVANDVESELNYIIQDKILDSLAPANGTLQKILTEKDSILKVFNNMLQDIQNVPVAGPAIVNGLSCMLPMKEFDLVNTAVDMMIRFLQRILGAKVYFPSFSFPDMSSVAVGGTQMAVVEMVEVIQDELSQYLYIFIVLSSAFGVLVLQGLFFVGVRRLAQRIRKQRRLSRMQS